MKLQRFWHLPKGRELLQGVFHVGRFSLELCEFNREPGFNSRQNVELSLTYN